MLWRIRVPCRRMVKPSKSLGAMRSVVAICKISILSCIKNRHNPDWNSSRLRSYLFGYQNKVSGLYFSITVTLLFGPFSCFPSQEYFLQLPQAQICHGLLWFRLLLFVGELELCMAPEITCEATRKCWYKNCLWWCFLQKTEIIFAFPVDPKNV